MEVLSTPQKVRVTTIRPRLTRLEPPPWETEEADEVSVNLTPQPGKLRRMFSRLSLSSIASSTNNSNVSTPVSHPMHSSTSSSPLARPRWLHKQLSTPNLLRKKSSFDQGSSSIMSSSICSPQAPVLPPIPQREDTFANDIFRALRRG